MFDGSKLRMFRDLCFWGHEFHGKFGHRYPTLRLEVQKALSGLDIPFARFEISWSVSFWNELIAIDRPPKVA